MPFQLQLGYALLPSFRFALLCNLFLKWISCGLGFFLLYLLPKHFRFFLDRTRLRPLCYSSVLLILIKKYIKSFFGGLSAQFFMIWLNFIVHKVLLLPLFRLLKYNWIFVAYSVVWIKYRKELLLLPVRINFVFYKHIYTLSVFIRINSRKLLRVKAVSFYFLNFPPRKLRIRSQRSLEIKGSS